MSCEGWMPLGVVWVWLQAVGCMIWVSHKSVTGTLILASACNLGVFYIYWYPLSCLLTHSICSNFIFYHINVFLITEKFPFILVIWRCHNKYFPSSLTDLQNLRTVRFLNGGSWSWVNCCLNEVLSGYFCSPEIFQSPVYLKLNIFLFPFCFFYT